MTFSFIVIQYIFYIFIIKPIRFVEKHSLNLSIAVRVFKVFLWLLHHDDILLHHSSV